MVTDGRTHVRTTLVVKSLSRLKTKYQLRIACVSSLYGRSTDSPRSFFKFKIYLILGMDCSVWSGSHPMSTFLWLQMKISEYGHLRCPYLRSNLEILNNPPCYIKFSSFCKIICQIVLYHNIWTDHFSCQTYHIPGTRLGHFSSGQNNKQLKIQKLVKMMTVLI